MIVDFFFSGCGVLFWSGVKGFNSLHVKEIEGVEREGSEVVVEEGGREVVWSAGGDAQAKAWVEKIKVILF